MPAVGTFAKGVATAALTVWAFVAITGGVAGSAASVPPGRIVFSSPLPAYPLPDDFEAERTFSIRLSGRHRRELDPAPDWIWSRDHARVYFTRDTATGAELWVERSDATGARRLALFDGSGPATSLGWSRDHSMLDVVAGSLFVVGADGSDPRRVFAPKDGSSVGEVTWSPDGSRLTFVAGDLWVADVDGSGATRIFTADQADGLDYTASPDGSRIVVESDGDWLLSADGGRVAQLPPEAQPGGIDWAPRGGSFAVESISYAGCGPEDDKCAEWYTLLFNADGVLLKRLDVARSAAWSPDGRHLVFESETAVDPEDGSIDVVNADGTGRTEVSRRLKSGGGCWRYPTWQANARVTFVAGGCDPDYLAYVDQTLVVQVPSGRVVSSLDGTDPTTSPKGRRFAYLEVVYNSLGTESDVRLIEVGPGRKRLRLSPPHGTVDDFAWSPNGRFLAYSFGRGAGEQVYLVSSGGGRPRQVTHELQASSEWDLRWSRDGRTIVYKSWLDITGRDTLWTVDAAGGAAQRLLHDQTNDQSPAWSPDGRRVAYTVDDRGDSAQIYVVNADGTGAHSVIGRAGEIETDIEPAWSPDGKRLAFVRSKGGGDLFLGVANADGTGDHTLKDAGSPYGAPTWSPDGSEIVFSDNGRALVAVAPDGTNRHPVIQLDCTATLCPTFGDASFSPDGSRIAVACSDCRSDTPNGGIWVLRADGTGLTRVADIYGSHPTWSPDGSSIAFSGACGPPASENGPASTQLCTVGADGSNLHAVTDWPYGAGGPSWSGG
jgi:TolB protein